MEIQQTTAEYVKPRDQIIINDVIYRVFSVEEELHGKTISIHNPNDDRDRTYVHNLSVFNHFPIHRLVM